MQTFIETNPWLSMAPFVPCLGRLGLILRYRTSSMRAVYKANDADASKSFIIELAGFSLAALTIVATSDSAKEFRYAVFDIIVSFLAFFSAMGLQSWKTYNWHDQVGDGLREAGNIALMLFIARFSVWLGRHLGWGPTLSGVLIAMALTVWIYDFTNHFGRTLKFFMRTEKENERRRREKDTEERGATGTAQGQAAVAAAAEDR